MPDQRSRTSLTRFAPLMADPDPKGAHKLAAAMWHNEGTVIIRSESIDRMDWQDRELVKAIAAKLYGPREAKA